MGNNQSLRKANKNKEDEFYTQLSDIEFEMKHYKKYFEDKVIFCNCDDPFESNFFKYFALNFNVLKLKKLVCTCYESSPIIGEQLSLLQETMKSKEKSHPYKIEINEIEDINHDGAVDLLDIEYLLKNKENALTLLNGNGDFRSEECIELLKESDIVVTNPPFSLFREYVMQLIEHNKKFLILGNQNAFTYKEIFSLIKENKIWTGYKNGDMAFRVPDYYEPRNTRFWIDEEGKKWRSFGNITWFTNLDVQKRHENIILYKKYNTEDYLKYDNYEAININKVQDIPCDFNGAMGVPITFLEKYNPEQFEIIDALNRYALLDTQNTNDKVQREHSHSCNINGKPTYFRVIIKKKE